MAWHKLTERVGSCIIQQRQKLSFTQEDLATEAFIDRAHLRKIEYGKTNASIRILAKIVRALQTTIYEILVKAENCSFPKLI